MQIRGKLEEHVINADGVLDLYADTYDEFDYWYNEEMMRMFGAMATVILKAMPISSVYVAALQERGFAGHGGGSGSRIVWSLV